MNQQTHTERLLPVAVVLDRTSLSRAKLYDDVKNGRFPAPVKISANRIAWPESVISRWINEKIAASAA